MLRKSFWRMVSKNPEKTSWCNRLKNIWGNFGELPVRAEFIVNYCRNPRRNPCIEACSNMQRNSRINPSRNSTQKKILSKNLGFWRNHKNSFGMNIELLKTKSEKSLITLQKESLDKHIHMLSKKFYRNWAFDLTIKGISRRV